RDHARPRPRAGLRLARPRLPVPGRPRRGAPEPRPLAPARPQPAESPGVPRTALAIEGELMRHPSLLATLALALVSFTPRPAPAAVTVSERDQREAVKHYRAGQDALTHELYEQAEQEFKQAVKLDPLLVAAHHGLGQTMMATKRYPEAVDA